MNSIGGRDRSAIMAGCQSQRPTDGGVQYGTAFGCGRARPDRGAVPRGARRRGVRRAFGQEPGDELVDLISRRVYDKLSIRPSNEQVVAVLSDEPVPLVALPTSEQSGRQVGREGANKRLPPSPAVQPTLVVLWGSRHSVKSHADVLRTVAEELFRRHADDFGKLLELKGRIHPFVARTPQALLKPERGYEVASSGYFIDMNLSAADILKRAERFLECFGYPPSDLEVLFD